jgi:hypothetical protein
MSSIFRIIVAVATLLIVIAMLAFGVVGIVVHQPILTVVCLVLVVGFGLFIVKDYKFFFGKKS